VAILSPLLENLNKKMLPDVSVFSCIDEHSETVGPAYHLKRSSWQAVALTESGAVLQNFCLIFSAWFFTTQLRHGENYEILCSSPHGLGARFQAGKFKKN
jgi:hypothetical protein